MVQEGLADQQKQEVRDSSALCPSQLQKKPPYSSSETSDEEEEEEDIRDLEGRTFSKMGREVSIKQPC